MSKYLADNQLVVTDLLHDIAGLKGPLSFAQDLIRKQNYDKALIIQSEILKKIKLIESELQKIPSTNQRSEQGL